MQLPDLQAQSIFFFLELFLSFRIAEKGWCGDFLSERGFPGSSFKLEAIHGVLGLVTERIETEKTRNGVNNAKCERKYSYI